MAEELLTNIQNYVKHLQELSKKDIDFGIKYVGKTFGFVYTVDRDFCMCILTRKPTNVTMLSFQGYIIKMERLMKCREGIKSHIH